LICSAIEIAISSCSEDFFIVLFVVFCNDAFLCLFDFDIDGNGDDNRGNNKDNSENNIDNIIEAVHNAIERDK